ncbi:iron-siderophore ABC transporter substrate-binding protein [Actinocorallia sp. A-T 12471]|uniref:iron-siderophore ABC transporter substrate-binding protein n=1 Tax=Actinocorallia sp. A-T 12471 TaxID=3089813 RepID=UPI0029D37F84|nr:iron-siderophore ABC transporter substrate-binding protein [Actinocorallia sp. A-T 12471]MDX6743328.1 iron-siderophore ABC transporter substrate-binding protein [Actinocorallia sp. A-T 12471]
MLSLRALRRPAAVAAAASLTLLLSACGATDADETTGPAQETAAFPVTITSSLGDAVITEEPKKIVTLGQGSTETAIALGTVPVGIEEYKWGSDDSGYLPWVHEAVKAKGAELPKQFTGGEELDIEAILELDPDVILAAWSGVTKEQFDLLSDIAPVVAYPGQAWSTPWQDQIKIVSKALGKADEGEDLIGDIKKQLADAAATRPNYAKYTFSYIYNTGPGSLGVFFPTEQRAEMVAALGLKPDPIVETFEEVEGTESASIGLENADKLKDTDVVFTFYSDAKNRKEIEAQPLYQAIPAIKNGAIVAPTEQPFVTGSSMINPLTVPWSIERFLPMIDAAIAKVK